MEAFFNHLGFIMRHAVYCRIYVQQDNDECITEEIKDSSSVLECPPWERLI